MKFYERLINEVEYGGKVYRIRPTYDKIIKIFYVFNHDEGLLPNDYIGLCLDMLVDGEHPEDPGLLSTIMNEISEETDKKTNEPVLFDFKQDSDLIYAAFMQAYGIDLHEEIGEMRWEKFLALFKGLPEETEFRQIVKLRATPVPKLDKNNGSYVRNLVKAKQAVALKKESQGDFYQGLKNIAQQLKAEAMKGR